MFRVYELNLRLILIFLIGRLMRSETHVFLTYHQIVDNNTELFHVNGLLQLITYLALQY